MGETATATKTEALATLRPGRQWVCFNEDKAPISPITLKGVSGDLVKDNKDWASYEEARKAWQANRSWVKGIGREFIKSQGITGIDLDDCIDADGKLSPYATYVVKLFNSYTEYSPSGRGLHIWVYGSLPSNLNTATKEDGDKRTEAYDCKRYFTITEKHLAGTPTTIEHRQEQLDAFHQEVTEWRQAAAAPRRTNTTRHNGTGDTPYGLKALQDECRNVALAATGARNTQLNTSAYVIGQLIGGGELSRTTVENALYDAGIAAGLGNTEVVKTMRSGINAGESEPRQAPENERYQEYKPGGTSSNGKGKRISNGHQGQPTVDDTQFILDCLGQKEWGDALLFAHLNKGKAVYDHTDGQWYLFGTHHWRLCCKKYETGKLSVRSPLKFS